MENKVSDNVIEKTIGSALNSMKSMKVGPAILTWQQQRLPLKICMSYTKMAYQPVVSQRIRTM